MIKRCFVVLTVLLTIISCRKELNITTPEVVVDPVDTEYITNVNGIVTDERGQVIADAYVVINGIVANTDETGYFSFKDVSLNVDGEIIFVQIDKFCDSYKIIKPKLGHTAYAHILVAPTKEIGSFDSAIAKDIIINDQGAAISVPAQTVIQSDGNNYNGNVRIFSYNLNPNEVFPSLFTPGNFKGIDKVGNEVQLEILGMSKIKLYSDSDQELFLSNGSATQITLPIYPDAINAAPDNIVLWSFNENLGIWTEEGTAQKSGANYIANTNLTGWIAIANPYETIELTMQLKNSNDYNLTENQIIITNDQNIAIAQAYSDNNGFVKIDVPKNTELYLNYFLSHCFEKVEGTYLGNYGATEDIGILEVDISQGYFELIGNVKDCDGNVPKDAYILLRNNQLSWIANINDDGSFQTMNLSCGGDNLAVQMIDNLSPERSEIFTINPQINQNYNLQDVSICKLYGDYFEYSVNGAPSQSIKNLSAIWNRSQDEMTFKGNWGDNQIDFTIKEDIGVGNNSLINFKLKSVESGIVQNYSCEGGSCNDLDLVILNIEEFIGGYWDGTISGTDANGNIIEASFRVKIEDIRRIVGGVFWIDSNQDGERSPFENIVGDIEITYFDENNNLLGSSKTKTTNGIYTLLISELRPIKLIAALPAGYKFTSKQTSTDLRDSDYNIESNETDLLDIKILSAIENIDGGIFME